MRRSAFRAGLPWFAAATALLLLASPARAALTAKDLQVAERALGFLVGRNVGALKIAVVYAADSAASRAEADALAALLADSPGGGPVRLVPVSPLLLDTGNLDALADRDVAFVTEGLAPWHAAIAAVAKPRHIVTVTADLDCVAHGDCVLGIKAGVRVQVLISRLAAAQSAIDFDAGFRLLVTEM